MRAKALPSFRGSRGSKARGRVRECDIQEAYFQYLNLRVAPTGALRWYKGHLGDYAYSVPNGVFIPGDPKRSAIIMAALKKQGLKTGVSDVVIAWPVYPFHGAYIELKRGKEKPTDEQQKWLDRMNDAGYYGVCAHGLDDAIRHTEIYCNGGLLLGGPGSV
jgi:hypothetical protein